MIGTSLQHYRIARLLGEGGMGSVYHAVDQLLERDVAVKLLHPELAREPELLERFRREAVTLARLNHPNITTLYGLGQDQDRLFMVMELVTGESLDTFVRRAGRLSWPRVVEIALQILSALDYAHGCGVIHRDLKPANLLMTVDGDVKVMDFGIARVLGSSRQTRQGRLIGTLEYMAPEQVRGQEGDPRTDLYSLGVVLYQLLTGVLPFEAADEYALMQAQINDAPAPPSHHVPELPAAIEQIVLQALAKDPDGRIQSAVEFAERLDTSVERPASGARRTRLASFTTGSRARATTTRAAAPTTAAAATVASPATKAAWPRIPGAAYAAAAAVIVAGIGVPAALWRTSSSAPAPATTSAASTVAAAAPAPPVQPADAMGPLDVPNQAPVVIAEPSSPVSVPRASRAEVPAAAPAPQKSGPAVARRRDPIAVPEVRQAAAPIEEPRAAEPEPPPPVVAAPSPAPAPPPPAAPAAALPELRFDKVKVLAMNGTKTKEIDAVLTFEGDRFRVFPKDGPARDVAYSSITSATYARSKHPRWRAGSAAVLIGGVFAAPVFLMKGTKHWLTVQMGEDLIVLRLDKGNYQFVLPAFETRTGRTVERTAGE